MIDLQNLSVAHRQGYEQRTVVHDVSLQVTAGECFGLVGPSGCGKSSLLWVMAGLNPSWQGTMTLAGHQATPGKPFTGQLRQDVQMVFQDPYASLHPRHRLKRTLAEPLKMLKVRDINERIEQGFRHVGLDPALADRYPHQLSGGQQQRIGVARALAADPEVLLMDEPFGALDPVTRATLQQEIARIHRLSGKTIVLVTHDIDEALALADRLVLMDGGKVVQQGTPTALLTKPVNDFVRRFFGQSEWGIRLLSLGLVGEAARRGEWLEEESIAETLTLREALSLFIARGTDRLAVRDRNQQPLGVLHFADLLRQRQQ
ncbi:MAG TPA: ATP-binding protein [Erwinia sp.]|nr:ATP-binding protein [Erwinia sp.]